MKYKEQQLYTRDAALTSEEKAAMRSRLMHHMRSTHAVHSAADYMYGSFLQQLRFAVGGLAVFMVLGMGISYAAENALPGDLLYSVKVGINERVWTWTAVSQEAQAEWSVARTTRRLEEAEQLATNGILNEKISGEITTRLKKDTEEASRAITSLKKERIDVAVGSSSRLESSLRIHEQALIQVAEERADMSSQIHVILDTVREKAERVSEIRKEIEKELAEITPPSIPDVDIGLDTMDASSTPQELSTPF